jgi:outer membrane protein assembly factor BamD (BamD/ComL family)
MKYIFSISIIFIMFSCKKETYGVKDQRILSLLNHSLIKDSVAIAADLIVKKAMATEQKDQRNGLLKLGFDITDSIPAYQMIFATELMKNDFKGSHTARALQLMSVKLKDQGRKELSAIFDHSLFTHFKDSKEGRKVDQASTKLINEAWLQKQGLEIFMQDDSTKLDDSKASKFVDICEGYAMSHPNETLSGDLLYQGAELARIMKTDQKAIFLYDELFKKFPSHAKAGQALFLKGFILENSFLNKQAAEQVYKDFIKIFPNHERINDVRFLLENLYVADEDLFKKMENKDQ